MESAFSTPPIITGCPNRFDIVAPLGKTSVPFTWIEPTATDNSGIPPTVRRSHQPGDSFPIGTTDVIYIFTDRAGNEATCSFPITIGRLY